MEYSGAILRLYWCFLALVRLLGFTCSREEYHQVDTRDDEQRDETDWKKYMLSTSEKHYSDYALFYIPHATREDHSINQSTNPK
jgi:hypothetical protein